MRVWLCLFGDGDAIAFGLVGDFVLQAVVRPVDQEEAVLSILSRLDLIMAFASKLLALLLLHEDDGVAVVTDGLIDEQTGVGVLLGGDVVGLTLREAVERLCFMAAAMTTHRVAVGYLAAAAGFLDLNAAVEELLLGAYLEEADAAVVLTIGRDLRGTNDRNVDAQVGVELLALDELLLLVGDIDAEQEEPLVVLLLDRGGAHLVFTIDDALDDDAVVGTVTAETHGKGNADEREAAAFEGLTFTVDALFEAEAEELPFLEWDGEVGLVGAQRTLPHASTLAVALVHLAHVLDDAGDHGHISLTFEGLGGCHVGCVLTGGRITFDAQEGDMLPIFF